jgi:TonB family protein
MVASYVQKLTKDRLEQRRSTLRIAEEWAETSSSRHSISSVPAVTAISPPAIKSSHAALLGVGGVLTGLAVAAAAATIYFRTAAEAPRATAGTPARPTLSSGPHDVDTPSRAVSPQVVEAPRAASTERASEVARPEPKAESPERLRAPERAKPRSSEANEMEHEAAAESDVPVPAAEATSEEPADAPSLPAMDAATTTTAAVVTASLPPTPVLVPVTQAAPVSKEPRLLASKLGHRQLLTNPSSKAVRVPSALQRSGQTFTATLNVCVDTRGEVSKVSILHSAGPALDPQIVELVSHWKYRPLLEAGAATPFCYPVNYQVEPE